jgi:hypothetical protein
VTRVAEKRVVLGGDTELGGSGWNVVCSDKHWAWEHGKAEHQSPAVGAIVRERRSWICNEKSFHVQTKCSIACEVLGNDDATFNGSVSLRFRALALGTLDITLELINDETSDQKRVEQRVEVVEPSGFRLECMTPTKRWGTCEDGISLQTAVVRAFPILDNSVQPSSLLRVNGKPGRFTEGANLADLVDGPLVPGPVEVKVSLGAKEQTFSLVVHE